MQLTDELLRRLAYPSTPVAARSDAQTHLLASMARELLAARKVVEAARKACAAKPGYRVHECLDLVLEDIIAYDKATNAARPQE